MKPTQMRTTTFWAATILGPASFALIRKAEADGRRMSAIQNGGEERNENEHVRELRRHMRRGLPLL
jgi:hypothetical protein